MATALSAELGDRPTAGVPNSLARLLRCFLAPYKRFLTVLTALQLAQTVAVLYLPTLSADLINHGVLGGNSGYVVRVGLVMIAVTVVQVACLIGVARFAAYTSMAVGRDIRTAIFNQIQNFSAREIGQFGTPSLVTRTTNDVQQVQMLVTATLTLLVVAPIMGIGGVVLALGQNVEPAVVLVVMLPLLSVMMLLIIRRLRPLSRIMQRRVDEVTRMLREQIAGVRVIRAFTQDEFEQRRFADANADLTDVSRRSGMLTTLMFPLASTTMSLFSVPIVWLGANQIKADHMQVGSLTALLGYLTLILVAVTTATIMLMMVPRAEACAERIEEVLRTQPSLVVPAKPVTRLSRPAHLDIDQVDFSYPGAEAPVLRGVSLIARPGELTAVIGSTGGGKSTLLGLVPRLADVSAGQVLVGGEDVRLLDSSVLAQAVALVPQNPRLFHGTVASNLRYGRGDATDDDLWRVLEIAQARDFVEALPDGLDSQVAQGSANLSGGQRQRLAIARALLRRPGIYLFDDALSALDYATEARLRAALVSEFAHAAVVMVSQRVASISHADRIVVLESGTVAGTGSHDELMRSNEIYREIVLSQVTEVTS
jgi:ATP-binding cassette, subfamily B, multidrug efflux pump